MLYLCLLLPLAYCSSTMVTVWGTPDIGFIPKNGWVSTQSWDDCVDNCSLNETCLAVHGDPDGVCTVYSSGNLYTVKNENAANTGNKVSFKIPSPPTECGSDISDMFLESNPIPGSSYATSTFKITSSAEEYTINYDAAYDGVDGTCKDWLTGTPGCDEPCNTYMLTFPASFGLGLKTLDGYFPERPLQRDCLVDCWLDADCFFVMSYAGYCNYYKYGGDAQIKKIENPSGLVGIKLTAGPSTCSMSLDQVIQGQVFDLPSDRTAYKNVKLRLDSGNMLRLEYGKDTIDCSSTNSGVFVYDVGCIQAMKTSLNYADAKAECVQLGGSELMTVPGNGKYAKVYDAWAAASTILPGNVHIGLTRADESSSWEWSIPSLADDTSFAWGENQPGSGNCAWMVTDKNQGATGPFLASHDCADLADGYLCYKANTF